MLLGIPNIKHRIGTGYRRAARRLSTLVGVALVLVVLSLAVGARTIAPLDVMRALAGGGGADAVVVTELRVPRTLVAIVAGAALAIAGCIAQTVTRNPLADPGVLGISAGAALGVVVAIRLAGLTTVGQWVPFAVAGSAVTAAVVLALGTVAGRPDPVRLAVAGLALATVLTAVTATVVLADRRTLDQYRVWSAGSVAGRDLGLLAPVAPVLACGALLGIAASRWLDALALGDEVAVAHGVPVGRARTAAVTSVALLVGGTTAICGPIAFVGLAVPHLVAALGATSTRGRLLACALAGPSALLVADVLGRVVTPPSEVPAGVMAALLGGPVLAVIARRSSGAGR